MARLDLSERYRPVTIGIFSWCLVGILGILRSFLDPALSLQIFYLLPISLITWVRGWKAGFFLSFGGILAEFLGMGLGQKIAWSSPLLYWNSLSLLIPFLGVSWLVAAVQDLKSKNEELAQIDPLTGVANGNCFFDRAEMEIKRARRYPRPFTVAYLDIDHFRKVNDHFGHSLGDALLKTLADLLKNQLRATDTPARIGGDEFAILLPETGFEAAQFALRRIQKVLTDAMHKNGWDITFTIGIVTFLHPPSHVDALLNRVEHAMHAAKLSGKNHLRHELYEKPSVLSSL